MKDYRKFYINGTWVEPALAQDHRVIDPATEEPCAVISLGSAADTDHAVEAALAAFANWSTSEPSYRLQLVEKILELYHARAEDMAQAISLEMGAPIDMARASQVTSGTWHIENFISAFQNFEFIKPLGQHAPNDRIALEPIGVVGLITPWNWPMNQVTLKVIPALLAGCTVVLKPSEQAPLSSLIFAEILNAAGLPRGVFNLVNGDGLGVGTHLSTHPDVQMISFTGSARAGIAISKAAADTHKRVCLELGGKGANLIFADADAGAVKRGVEHMFNNAGQSCNAPSRMLVERSIYEQAVTTAKQIAEATVVADPRLPGTHMGPVVNQRQYDHIQNYIRQGIDAGAKLIAGGLGRPLGMNRGYYIRPTVFADVVPGMSIEREEIFGPVLVMMPFDSEDEAVATANNTPYGLTNYVQSQNPERLKRVARKLRSGMVEMNGHARAAGSPFGGIKASGRAREGGHWGIEEFLEVKAISGWPTGALKNQD